MVNGTIVAEWSVNGTILSFVGAGGLSNLT